MIIELGHFATILALGIALVQMIIPAWGAYKKDEQLMSVAVPAAQMQFLLLSLAFATLIYSFVVSDFSVLNVYNNSHSAKPLIYKISGAWGNHEGSMLLWVLIVALFGALVATFGNNLPKQLKANVLAVQASIGVAFLLFIIVTSSPFARLFPTPAEGQGLNPILQDPALAFHPPFLYVGYVGFSMAFSFAIAALLDGKIDAAWARWVRPWTLVAWMFLTVGIAMGSWWAYYELGWGGWWFWDPVENASFMPWLAGTALLHSAVVMEKRDTLKIWTILLAILTFSLSLMGAFLVRSGVLNSVHAFAVDPERGVIILLIMMIFIGGALTLFAARASALKNGGLFSPISREASLLVNNLFLTAACGVVVFGTLYPLFYEAFFGLKITVGAPFFNIAFGAIMIPTLLLVPLGPFLAWKRGDLVAVYQRIMFAFAIAVFAVLLVYALDNRGPTMAPIGVGLGVWLIAGAINDLTFRTKLGKVPVADTFRKLVNLPRSILGTAVAHAGVGIMVLGIVGTSAWQSEKVVALKVGESVNVAGYDIQFKGLREGNGENYRELTGVFSVRQGGAEKLQLFPSKRLYLAQRQPTTEAGIYASIAGDLYIVLGEPLKNKGFSVRVYFNPLVRFIWIGAIIMFLGGLLSLSDRRLRVGAPRKNKAPSAIPAAAE
ncbi:MAG: heme lyase CcmF/NrfE family subunit [Methyloligellaceae bacterium]